MAFGIPRGARKDEGGRGLSSLFCHPERSEGSMLAWFVFTMEKQWSIVLVVSMDSSLCSE